MDLCLPIPRSTNEKIKRGPFKITELLTAIMDMKNDKAAGVDGYGIEVEKYIADEQYMELQLAMYNDILEKENMPAIMRDVIITVLYKGKGPRDSCDN